VKNAHDPGEIKNSRATAPHFKNYAGHYDFTHLLLIEQAYQESGLERERHTHFCTHVFSRSKTRCPLTRFRRALDPDLGPGCTFLTPALRLFLPGVPSPISPGFGFSWPTLCRPGGTIFASRV
jgi:hypothetical protein